MSRQVMVPPLPSSQQCHPTSLWFLPEGGVSSSQVQGKQGRVGGWPLARMGSDQHLHPPLIKDEYPPCQGLGQRRQGWEMNSEFL